MGQKHLGVTVNWLELVCHKTYSASNNNNDPENRNMQQPRANAKPFVIMVEGVLRRDANSGCRGGLRQAECRE